MKIMTFCFCSDEFESKLATDGLRLPEQYFIKDRNYPPSRLPRPQPNVPSKYVDAHSGSEYDQNAIVNHLSSTSLQKWIKESITLEMRLLFLRTRNLDISQKNQMVADVIKAMFPNINGTNLKVHAKSIRRNFYDWRNILWTNIKTKYKWMYSHNTTTIKELNKLLVSRHVHEIFRPWLQYIPNTISQETEQVLRDVILFGFWCLMNYTTKPHNEFFTANADLYTINIDFKSISGYNIATSMDMSKYEISAPRSFKNNPEETASFKKRKSN